MVGTPALFERDGDVWSPTEFSRGAWDPRACFGGPVAALIVRLVEDLATDDQRWQLSRVTLEMLHPVPLDAELHARTEIERPGRKVSLVGVSLFAGDLEVTRARVLRTRLAPAPLSPRAVQPPDDPPGSPIDANPRSGNSYATKWPKDAEIAFHTHGVEFRFVDGGGHGPGAADVWIRLAVPLLAGEEPSGVQRVVAGADFANGVSAGLPLDEYTYINPESTVYLIRPPVGEWVGMRSRSYYGTGGSTSGAGMTDSALYDLEGRLGRGVMSLLVQHR